MKKLKIIDWLIIILAILLLIIAFSSSALAGWGQLQITLKPGESKVVNFTNPDNAPIALAIANVSAPSQLLPYVIVSPPSIPENSTADVTITFIYVPKSVRENIAPDLYAVQVDSLMVYLDMGKAPENAENLLAEVENIRNSIAILAGRISLLSNKIDALENRPIWIENLLDRVTLLEKTPRENWAAAIENLLTELESLPLWTSENSGISREEFETFQASVMGTLAQMKGELEREIEGAKSKSVEYATIAGAMAVLVMGGILLKFRSQLPLKKPRKPRGATESPEELKPKTSW